MGGYEHNKNLPEPAAPHYDLAMADNPRVKSTNEDSKESRTSLFSSKLIITDAVIAALVVGSYLVFRSQPEDYGFGPWFWVIISLVLVGIAITSFRMVEINRLRRRMADSAKSEPRDVISPRDAE